MARTVFHGGLVFDGTGAPATAGDVVIENGRIVEVGAPGLDGDDEVDCRGLIVLPGPAPGPGFLILHFSFYIFHFPFLCLCASLPTSRTS